MNTKLHGIGELVSAPSWVLWVLNEWTNCWEAQGSSDERFALAALARTRAKGQRFEILAQGQIPAPPGACRRIESAAGGRSV